jgi:hypothetical protein
MLRYFFYGTSSVVIENLICFNFYLFIFFNLFYFFNIVILITINYEFILFKFLFD